MKTLLTYKSTSTGRSAAVMFLALLSFMLISAPSVPAGAMRALLPNQNAMAPGTIRGTVTSVDGNPIGGIIVTAYQWGSDYWYEVQSVRADVDGNYQISNLEVGLYQIGTENAPAPYLDTYHGNVGDIQSATELAIAGNTIENVDIVPIVGGAIQGSVQVSNTLLQEQSQGIRIVVYKNEPTNQSEIFLQESFPLEADTYLIQKLPPGDYRVCASILNEYQWDPMLRRCYDSSAGDLASATPISVMAGTTLPDINFSLGDPSSHGAISGQVTDEAGIPLEGIIVVLQSTNTDGEVRQQNACSNSPFYSVWQSDNQGSLKYCTFTDETGQYSLPFVIPENFTLYFQDPTASVAPQFYGNASDRDSATVLEVTTETVLENVDASLVVGGRITGTVLLQEISPPQSGTVTAYRESNGVFLEQGTSRVDPETGLYELTGLPTGTYSVTASLAYANRLNGIADEVSSPVEVTTGEVVANLDFSLADGLYEGVIQGQVTNRGNPIEGVKVSLLTLNDAYPEPIYSTRTDSEGNYKIEGIGGTRNRLWFFTLGQFISQFYNDTTVLRNAETLTIGHNETKIIDVELMESGGISGAVQDSSASARSLGVLVKRWLPSGELETVTSAQVDSSGVFSILGLLPGEYLLDFYNSAQFFPLIGGNADDSYISLLQLSATVEEGQITSDIIAVLGAGEPTALETSDEPTAPTAPINERLFIPFSTQ